MMNWNHWNPTYSTVCTLPIRRIIRRVHSVREAVRRSPSHTHRVAPQIVAGPLLLVAGPQVLLLPAPQVPSDVLAVLGHKHRVIGGFWCCDEYDVPQVDAYLSAQGIYHRVSGRYIEMGLDLPIYLVR